MGFEIFCRALNCLRNINNELNLILYWQLISSKTVYDPNYVIFYFHEKTAVLAQNVRFLFVCNNQVSSFVVVLQTVVKSQGESMGSKTEEG